MSATRKLLATGLLLGMAGGAAGHHSFAPHFDVSKPVVITGTITEYEQRNPHAYLHVSAVDENGLTREYVCESHGFTQLSRNGITPEMLQPGTTVTLNGAQHRREPYMCFFNSVRLGDGPVLNVNGTRGTDEPVVTEPERDDIFGTWMLVPANRSTSGPQPMINFMTPAGQAAVADYDPFIDDPTFRCDPVAIRRVWFAPGTPLEISRNGQTVVLRHEWMDAERTIHLDLNQHPVDVERSSLGHSIGRFEDDTLVIETGNYSAGVLRQYVEMPGEPTRGLLHSEDLKTVERLQFDRERNRLVVAIEHSDPTFFTRDFSPSRAEYAPSTMALQPFGCRPENPDQTLID